MGSVHRWCDITDYQKSCVPFAQKIFMTVGNTGDRVEKGIIPFQGNQSSCILIEGNWEREMHHLLGGAQLCRVASNMDECRHSKFIKKPQPRFVLSCPKSRRNNLYRLFITERLFKNRCDASDISFENLTQTRLWIGWSSKQIESLSVFHRQDFGREGISNTSLDVWRSSCYLQSGFWTLVGSQLLALTYSSNVVACIFDISCDKPSSDLLVEVGIDTSEDRFESAAFNMLVFPYLLDPKHRKSRFRV